MIFSFFFISYDSWLSVSKLPEESRSNSKQTCSRYGNSSVSLNDLEKKSLSDLLDWYEHLIYLYFKKICENCLPKTSVYTIQVINRMSITFKAAT